MSFSGSPLFEEKAGQVMVRQRQSPMKHRMIGTAHGEFETKVPRPLKEGNQADSRSMSRTKR